MLQLGKRNYLESTIQCMTVFIIIYSDQYRSLSGMLKESLNKILFLGKWNNYYNLLEKSWSFFDTILCVLFHLFNLLLYKIFIVFNWRFVCNKNKYLMLVMCCTKCQRLNIFTFSFFTIFVISINVLWYTIHNESWKTEKLMIIQSNCEVVSNQYITKICIHD